MGALVLIQAIRKRGRRIMTVKGDRTRFKFFRPSLNSLLNVSILTGQRNPKLIRIFYVPVCFVFLFAFEIIFKENDFDRFYSVICNYKSYVLRTPRFRHVTDCNGRPTTRRFGIRTKSVHCKFLGFRNQSNNKTLLERYSVCETVWDHFRSLF